MKSAIILSIFATLYFNIGVAAWHRDADFISALKTRVDETTKDLSRYIDRWSMNLGFKLDNMVHNQMDDINKILFSAIDDVHNTVKEKGKDANEHCFKPARSKLQNIAGIAHKEVKACAQFGKSTINSVRRDIEEAVLLEKDVIRDIDGMLGRIPAAMTKFETFEKIVKELKREIEARTSKIVDTAFRCSLEVASEMRQQAHVHANVVECINKVLPMRQYTEL